MYHVLVGYLFSPSLSSFPIFTVRESQGCSSNSLGQNVYYVLPEEGRLFFVFFLLYFFTLLPQEKPSLESSSPFQVPLYFPLCSVTSPGHPDRCAARVRSWQNLGPTPGSRNVELIAPLLSLLMGQPFLSYCLYFLCLFLHQNLSVQIFIFCSQLLLALTVKINQINKCSQWDNG